MVPENNQIESYNGNQSGFFGSKRPDGEKAVALHLTGKQVDKLLDISANTAPDIINIVKGIVDIARIRSQTDADVKVIEAQTSQVVVTTRAEIDRLRQSGETIRTRGEVVTQVLLFITLQIEKTPDFDSTSRLAIIESLKDILGFIGK